MTSGISRGRKIIKEITEFSKAEENTFPEKKGTVSIQHDESTKHIYQGILKASKEEKWFPGKECESDRY